MSILKLRAVFLALYTFVLILGKKSLEVLSYILAVLTYLYKEVPKILYAIEVITFLRGIKSLNHFVTYTLSYAS